MAQRVNIVLVDDIDGSEATETVSFGLDGTSYEIDLNDKNAPPSATRWPGTSGTPARSAPRPAAAGGGAAAEGPPAAEIREWARSQGMDVPERGRVSADVRSAYDAAH